MMKRREFVKLCFLLFVALILDGWWLIKEAMAAPQKPQPIDDKVGGGWSIPWSIPWNVAPTPLPHKQHVYFLPLILRKLHRNEVEQ